MECEEARRAIRSQRGGRPARPVANSSTHLRALAIAISRLSRRDGVIGVLCAGT